MTVHDLQLSAAMTYYGQQPKAGAWAAARPGSKSADSANRRVILANMNGQEKENKAGE